ncbi:thiamine-phosphate kinase [Thiohalomonas denitrificans]|uniref:Thiamine-monophosphate kinase n=1 Tax=Thiohalomonas denitrificans TaxID=415747 RepID=A0A1G5Q073_9GAMM|nr:thiamine-phosphate kinase [Thiohalomonas denitrificans]SCZ55058.1 thiamine-monophosphate kinase [Thiohalomonas denitrificans]
MALSEFQLIDRVFAARAAARADVSLGIGDDAALLSVPAGMELAVAIDGLHAGIHFPEDTDPKAIGHKALAVNLSDLAAMGADPAWATLFLSLPHPDETFASHFADGFFSLAERFGVALVGGDTVRGPLCAVVQAHGFVPAGEALRRSGARPGDGIYVTGTLGDAGAGLGVVQGRLDIAAPDGDFLRNRLDYPEARLRTGRALRGVASAAIDVSDGILSDLGHILSQSGVGGRIEIGCLPRSEVLLRTLPEPDGINLALSAGDDYELCFTVAADHEPRLQSLAEGLECPITRIGRIESESGLRLIGPDGRIYACDGSGYDHFKGTDNGRDDGDH